MMGTILLWIVIITAAAVGCYLRIRGENERRQQLGALAARLGFRFRPDKDEGFTMGWGFLQSLARGNERYAFNILEGTLDGHRAFVFDYYYRIGSGKNREIREVTLLMLIFDAAFPALRIRHETPLAPLAEVFGFGDIKFESAEFSRLFNVQCVDKKFAFDVCNPQMIDYLLANRDLEIEIQGPCILLTPEKLLDVDRIDADLRRLIEIRSRLPDYLFTRN